MNIRPGIAVAAVVVTGLGVGGVTTLHAAPAAAPHKSVKIAEVNNAYGFTPKKLTIKVGTRVVWTNTTDAPHTVTGTRGWSFSSQSFSNGQSIHVTFKKAGTYHYMCNIHPYMKGTIVVKK